MSKQAKRTKRENVIYEDKHGAKWVVGRRTYTVVGMSSVEAAVLRAATEGAKRSLANILLGLARAKIAEIERARQGVLNFEVSATSEQKTPLTTTREALGGESENEAEQASDDARECELETVGELKKQDKVEELKISVAPWPSESEGPKSVEVLEL